MVHTITRRLDHTLEVLGEEFDVLYCDRDYHQVLDDMKHAQGGYWDQNANILLSMLKENGLSCEPAASCDTEYYEKVIANYVKQGAILTKEKLGDKLQTICRKLAEEYVRYPTPSEYMERLVNRLSDPEDGWQSDPIRLQILKQFIKYGNYALPMLSKGSPKKKIKDYVKAKIGKDVVSQAEVLAHIDDAVFEQIKDCDLLEMCKALASGQYHTNGGAKRDLYLFAFVYKMTYFSYTQERAVYDEERDINKNLFQDYYATNLMQYISQAHRDKPTASALDPSDCAINYKNFAEVICLFYLCQNISSEEKIKRASNLIREMTNTESEDEEVSDAVVLTDSNTVMMRDAIYGPEDDAGRLNAQKIMDMPEEDFRAFLYAHYNPSSRYKTLNQSPFVVSAFGHTAAQEYKRIAARLKAGAVDTEYGLFFDDVRRPNGSQLPADDYIKILTWVDKTLCEGLSHQDEAVITRTQLLVAYYYAFNADNNYRDDEDDDALTYKKRSFPEHYEAFRRGADNLFTRVGYAPFSHKNLLDLIVAVSSYLYIYA